MELEKKIEKAKRNGQVGISLPLWAEWESLHASVQWQRDFSGGPMAKTPHSQYKGYKFGPWSGN